MAKINGEALREECYNKDLKLTEASKKIGYKANYLSNSIRKGEIRGSALELLQMKFGIDPDAVLIREEIEPEQIEGDPELDAGMEKLIEIGNTIIALAEEIKFELVALNSMIQDIGSLME